ncbi:MAG TPA: CRTAC1 family protein [Solirubrobacterales bacterium]|nr:CRTAC1 family protein [Solirubrobacterales bacterium]
MGWRQASTCIAAIVLAALVAAAAPAPAAKPRLVPAPRVDFMTKRLFDIGVADPDRDGHQDIFTTNHKFRSVFLRNSRGTFRNVINQVGLGPDSRYPGLDLMRPPADRSDPGVYIWPSDEPGDAGRLHLESTGVTVSGRVRLMTRKLAIRSQRSASAALGRDQNNRPYIDFTIAPGGEVVFASNGLSDLPIQFEFAESGPGAVSTDEIKVGADGVSPEAPLFQIMLRDRHGIAFADVAGSRDQDAFVVTGGLGGGIASPLFLGAVRDQFLVAGAGQTGGYGDEIVASGIVKGRCRGRSAAYADADGRGGLDLLTTCEGDPPQMYAQTMRGGFVPVPAPPAVGVAYRWAPLGGRRPTLLVSTRRGLESWKLKRGGWRRVENERSGREAEQIALGDFDNSGTLDVMTTGHRGVSLFANRRGHLRPVRSRRGLPRNAAAASFVDYDNDGRLDVSLAPQGIYRWDRRRDRFVRTGALVLRRTGYAIVEWMDYDNDGRRDPLIAASAREFSPGAHVIRKRNVTRAGHWLEVELTGSARNREAIGASVRARFGGGRTLTQWVGQNDDARHSQGHYRLYFGLGRARAVKRLTVRWPGGGETRLRKVRADRLLRISRRR